MMWHPTEGAPTADAVTREADSSSLDAGRESSEASKAVEAILLRARRIRRRLERVQVAIVFPAFAWFLYLVCYTARHGSTMPDPAMLSQYFLIAASLLPAWLAGRAVQTVRPDLAMLDDVRLVGPLVEQMDTGDAETRRVLREAVRRLLPRLQEEDAHRLDAGQTRKLYGALKRAMPGDVDFALAVLRALGRIGDATAVPVVLELSHLPPRDPPGPFSYSALIEQNADVRQAWRARNLQEALCRSTDRRRQATTQEERDRLHLALSEAERALDTAVWQAYDEPYARVRQAARECLPLLRERIQRMQATGALLRPADAPDADRLLRPAEGVVDTDPQKLLRAVDSQQPGT